MPSDTEASLLSGVADSGNVSEQPTEIVPDSGTDDSSDEGPPEFDPTGGGPEINDPPQDREGGLQVDPAREVEIFLPVHDNGNGSPGGPHAVDPDAVTGGSGSTESGNGGQSGFTNSSGGVVVSPGPVVIDEPISEPIPQCPVSSQVWQNAMIPMQTGIFTAEFDAIPNVAPMDGIVGLSFGAASSYAQSAVTVRFHLNTGRIDARHGSVYTAVTPIPTPPESIITSVWL
jgi:hypothetical protein